MNKRALAYLAMASATLALAFLYVTFAGDSTPKVTGSPTNTAAAQPTFDTRNYVQTAASLPLLTVRNNQLLGEPMRLKVQKGEVARFQVISDVSDEVHIHGLNHHFDLKPNQVRTIELPTGHTGAFEIELHKSPLTLGVLEVYPAQ